MEPNRLLCLVIVPAMEKIIPWADDSWAFKKWKQRPTDKIIEYLAFRELALERKKCLTIAQYTMERFVENTGQAYGTGTVSRDVLAKAELDKASMNMFLRQAKMIESYINIMLALGDPWWTTTVDESVVPKWMCATQVISSYAVCTSSIQDDCKSECDNWAKSQMIDTSLKANQVNTLEFWRRQALGKVVDRWVQVTHACDKQN